MTITRNIRMLTRYNAWANVRLFTALAALPDSVTGERNGRSINSTLSHALVVDRIWRAHLEGKAHGFTSRNLDVLPALSELAKDQAQSDAWYIGYADSLTDAAHDEVIHFKFVDGGAGAMTRGDMLLHVANHKTYHRGYVAEMLYQAGLKPPTMDLPVFLRDAPPGF